MTRRSRRELERAVDELSGADYGDLEPLSLAELLSYETEVVDDEAGVVKIVETGELRNRGNVDDEILRGLKDVYDEE